MGDRPTIAVLGAGGIMGKPMARNLAEAGFAVRGWNRTRGKAEQDWVDVAGSPAEAADGAPLVLTMLADTDAVLDAVAGALRDDVVWLQMSTIGIEGTERAKALADEKGATFIDAPVLGTKGPAEAGELVVIASGAGGDDAARAAAREVFDAVGKRTVWAGEAGAATRLKLVANAWILALVEAIGETFALAEGLGVEHEAFLDVVAGGAMDLPYLQMKGKAIMARDFEPAFRLVLAAKDAGLVAAAAKDAGLDLPLIDTVRDRMREGIEEHGDKDMSATYLTSSPAQ